MTPEENAFNVVNVSIDALQAMVNHDERPFTTEERAELNKALTHLHKQMTQLSLLTNLTLGAATLAGFLMGALFTKLIS